MKGKTCGRVWIAGPIWISGSEQLQYFQQVLAGHLSACVEEITDWTTLTQYCCQNRQVSTTTDNSKEKKKNLKNLFNNSTKI